MGHRAGGDLGTLQRLAQHYDDGTFVMGLAVSGLRARGYSDAEFAGAPGGHQAGGQPALAVAT